MYMILHNLKIAWRNLMKHKFQNAVSMLSLTVGMVCFALSALWLKYEHSYDAWWPDAENVYMLQCTHNASAGYEDGEPYSNYLSFPAGQRQRERIPQIDKLARMQVSGCMVLPTPACRDSIGCGIFGIDDGVQEMMGIRVLEGRKKLVLKADEAALPLSMARRLFGQSGAVGQKLYCTMSGKKRCLTVVAVIEDIRRPTSFAFSFLTGPDEECENSDNMWSTGTFIRVRPENVDKVAKALEKEVMTIPLGPRNGVPTGKAEHYKRELGYRMLPLKEVRRSNVTGSNVVQYSHLWLFVILGVIVICCALFNYFTMLITRIRIRRRELALRYVHGAGLWSLLGLLSTEMLLLLFVSVLAAVGIVGLTLEDFKEVCRIDEPRSFFVGWFLVYALAAAVVSFVVTAVIVLFSNRYQLHQAAGRHRRPDSFSIHTVLLTLQLAVSVGAVFCSFVMMNQIHYLFSSPDMGFAKHNRGALWVARRYDSDEGVVVDVPSVKQMLQQMPEIEDFLVDYVYPIPGGFNSTTEVKTEDIDRLKLVTARADEHYFRFMELQMVEGEFISSHDDSKMVCINETAARALGKAGRVGGTFSSLYDDGHYVVKGIVRDLSYASPTTPIQPMMFVLRRENLSGRSAFLFPFRVKEGTDRVAFNTKIMNSAWNVCSSDLNAVSVFFAEEIYDMVLRSERLLCRLLMLVTIVCVLIALSGILSMVSLSCERRRREIAIRKVHGARTSAIIRLFLRYYIRLLLASGILAFPVGYYLMHLWVRQYVKQAPIPLWIYPSILLAMAVLIFLTVYWQIRRAARQNPSDVIKSD